MDLKSLTCFHIPPFFKWDSVVCKLNACIIEEHSDYLPSPSDIKVMEGDLRHGDKKWQLIKQFGNEECENWKKKKFLWVNFAIEHRRLSQLRWHFNIFANCAPQLSQKERVNTSFMSRPVTLYLYRHRANKS